MLRDALSATPLYTKRWLQLVIAIDVALAVACMALAAWLVMRGQGAEAGLRCRERGTRCFRDRCRTIAQGRRTRAAVTSRIPVRSVVRSVLGAKRACLAAVFRISLRA